VSRIVSSASTANRVSRNSMACRRANNLRSSGNSSALGILAPFTKTGTIVPTHLRAVRSHLGRQCDVGPGRRRHPSIHGLSGPLLFSRARFDFQSSWITSTPGRIASTSMNRGGLRDLVCEAIAKASCGSALIVTTVAYEYSLLQSSPQINVESLANELVTRDWIEPVAGKG
jgi:hypothetical protein